MAADEAFTFLEPGVLTDGEIEVRLVRCHPEDPARDWVPWYEFSMHFRGVGFSVGQMSFRAGEGHWLENYGGHVGYGVDPPFRGHHVAERAVRLILPFIRRHGFKRIWITCNPENWASRRTCERLGGVMVEIVDLPRDTDLYQRGERQKCRYRLDL